MPGIDPGSSAPQLRFNMIPGVELAQADVYDADALVKHFNGADAVVSMAGILNEGGSAEMAFTGFTLNWWRVSSRPAGKPASRACFT